jgi:hypothetical protein
MKVHELITKLQSLNQDLDVYVPSSLTEFDYNFAYTVSPKWLTLEESDDYPDETLVLIIDET